VPFHTRTLAGARLPPPPLVPLRLQLVPPPPLLLLPPLPPLLPASLPPLSLSLPPSPLPQPLPPPLLLLLLLPRPLSSLLLLLLTPPALLSLPLPLPLPPTNVGAALNRSRRCPTRCTDPVWTKPRGQGGRPTATHNHGIASALLRLLTATAAPAMTWLPLNVVIVVNDRGDSPSSYRARALGVGAQLVLQRCPRVPLGCMQGGNHWSVPAV